MEERDNKTIMCSVLFLDIVEYSKRSVTGQISLKDRFNSYLSTAISSVPITDRIILDTGDGAAINFLGDVEDALKTALSLRESMLNEDASIDPPLLVRAGINLGPVRLVRDINGQPNIVGDGINVAQRVMGFADVGQILVSRSYYDAVSRLSSQYTGMFHFQGSRTDKHVREHEVYAIGYPGDKTTQLPPARGAAGMPWHVKFGAVAGGLVGRFKQADPRQRALYAGTVALSVALIGALALKLAYNGEAPVLPGADQVQAASGIQPVSAVASAAPAAPHAESKAAGTGSTAMPTA
ncbi:MAG: adenylate/guanylate cyclase domain-containing protein [Gallionella sp.]|nr:adenylate/guanylate cyclase domain-containing protein [Gallionella sp.]